MCTKVAYRPDFFHLPYVIFFPRNNYVHVLLCDISNGINNFIINKATQEYVTLQHVLNDPVGSIYTPVIFSLICMYITKYWLPSRGRMSLLQCYYRPTRNDDLQLFSNCQYLTAKVIS